MWSSWSPLDLDVAFRSGCQKTSHGAIVFLGGGVFLVLQQGIQRRGHGILQD